MNNTASKKSPKFAAQGARVRVTRSGVNLGVGRYVGPVQKRNGLWHNVNMAAPRQAPDVRTYRATSLARV